MNPTGITNTLARQIVQQIEDLVQDSETETKPLELDPYRGKLFELFVTAEGAGFLEEDTDCDLTADGLCRELAERWGLGDSMRNSLHQEEKMTPELLARMRTLWSIMRMWMEWTYAWNRWAEFHPDPE